MEKNKRILTFAEFSKEYSKGDPTLDGPAVDVMKDASSELNKPVIHGSKEGIDSIEKGPATRKIKTDYEMTPQPQVKSKEASDSKSVDKVETEKIENVDNKNLDNIDKKKKKMKKTKQVKKSSKKTEEDEREESGEY